MANEEQLSILKQGVDVWNKWSAKNFKAHVDLSRADLGGANLGGADLCKANLKKARLGGATCMHAKLTEADLEGASLLLADLRGTDLKGANLRGAFLLDANLKGADLTAADLGEAVLWAANLMGADLRRANFSRAKIGGANLNEVKLHETIFLEAVVGATIFGNSNLSEVIGLEDVVHMAPSQISTDTFALSNGRIPTVFLRGCGLSDWEIEDAKLYNPELNNEEVNAILYKMYSLRASQALQISPLFISYSHADGAFVDKIESHLNKKGIRFWRDIHDMKSGRMEKQIDRAIRLNPTVMLILSKDSLQSDWVEHEVRTARALEKETKRDVLCPVALDDSWKNSPWAKRIMEQIMEYNILDFSNWKDEPKFEDTFDKLVDGLELFYK